MHKFFSVRAREIQDLENQVNTFLTNNPDIVIVTSNQSLVPVGDTQDILYSIIYKEAPKPTRIGRLGQD